MNEEVHCSLVLFGNYKPYQNLKYPFACIQIISSDPSKRRVTATKRILGYFPH